MINEDIFKEPYEPHIIDIKDPELNWDKINFDKYDWDLEVRGLPYQVVRATYHVDGKKGRFAIGYPISHCIGGKWGHNNLYAYPLFKERYKKDDGKSEYHWHDEGPTRENLIEFDGEAPTWGIICEETNYFRKGEIRKGGNAFITRNGRKFYEIHTGSISYGASSAFKIIAELQEHPCNFSFRNWKKELENRKIWYGSIPAITYHVMEDQGCIMVKPDPDIGIPFNVDPYMIESDGTLWSAAFDERDDVKVDYLYKQINWFRDDKQTEAFIKLRNQSKNKFLERIKELQDDGRLSQDVALELQKVMFGAV